MESQDEKVRAKRSNVERERREWEVKTKAKMADDIVLVFLSQQSVGSDKTSP